MLGWKRVRRVIDTMARAVERGYTRTQTSVGVSMRVPRIEHDQRYPVESKS
jgi:hypothetical protein